MKKYLFFPLVLVLLFIISCGENEIENGEKSLESKTISNENEVLYTFLEKSGNYINSDNIPAMVGAEEVFSNLAKYLVIDTRRHDDYVEGHIDGAVNVEMKSLMTFLEDSISANTYEKVVLVCYSNHYTSYATSLLRMLGYGNIYALTWGMSAWDKTLAADKWVKNISDKYVSKLETKENQPPAKSNQYPEIKTGQSTGYTILRSRVEELLQKEDFLTTSDSVFASPEKYFIVNYWTLEHYKIGHIPGAFQFEPKKSLTKDAQLSSLPLNKPIVVYCYSGQPSTFVTAYLRLLGYDAKSMKFGANAFMHNKLISSGIGHAFSSSEDIKNYPLTEGEKPSKKAEIKQGESQKAENNAAPPKTVPKKKKNGGGGC